MKLFSNTGVWTVAYHDTGLEYTTTELCVGEKVLFYALMMKYIYCSELVPYYCTEPVQAQNTDFVDPALPTILIFVLLYAASLPFPKDFSTAHVT
jgi:hypothetical protein